MTSEETWQKWDCEIHESLDAKKWLISAQNADLTPIKVEDKEDKTYGFFQGRNGSYEISLDFCPCGDFRKRKLPCKHIYRLAMELHLIEGNPISDTSKIKIPKNKNGLELIPALDIVESCPKETQQALFYILDDIRQGTYRVAINKNDITQELLDKDIIIECNDNELKYKALSKKGIVKLLKKQGFDGGVVKTPHEELIHLALLHLPEYVQTECEKKIVVRISDTFTNIKMKLYRYLLRKFYSYTYYDGADMHEVVEYPNDEITALLKQRGFLGDDANIVDRTNKTFVTFTW